MHILTVNRGSSSLKFTLFDMRDVGAPRAEPLLSGSIERLGSASAAFQIKDNAGKSVLDQNLINKNSPQTIQIFLDWIKKYFSNYKLAAVGHRIVHGGSKLNKPCIITPEILDYLNSLIPFATEHLPVEIEVINAFKNTFPDILQIACFDTAFHCDKPDIAKMTPLPRELSKEGVIRYGFHGLSYEYIMSELKNMTGEKTANSRVVIAHLGNGSSMSAVKNSRCVETTMGFTPTGGLMMGTRCGDIDPGLIFYLLEQKSMPVSEVKNISIKRSGLLGVSEISSDVETLLKSEEKNPFAGEAINLYCYTAKKFIGSLASVLNGIDILIFTAGIGENAPSIRERICKNMEYLGIEIDLEKNNNNEAVISKEKSKATVRVMKTNEALMIARHTTNMLTKYHGG
ncbi:MAG: acetate/propionate family kinase [bacterium]|nr:acetate/propionate family kinase [bacterium]